MHTGIEFPVGNLQLIVREYYFIKDVSMRKSERKKE